MNFKHTGLFPEQSVNWDFAQEQIRSAGRPVSVLNLFAYTGAASVACAAAGASVCHVVRYPHGFSLPVLIQKFTILYTSKWKPSTKNICCFGETEIFVVIEVKKFPLSLSQEFPVKIEQHSHAVGLVFHGVPTDPPLPPDAGAHRLH